MVKKYGLNVLVTIDDSLKSYLKKLLTQVEGIFIIIYNFIMYPVICILWLTCCVLSWVAWLNAGKISKLVLAIMNVETREILERWQFDIQIIDENNKENKGMYVL